MLVKMLALSFLSLGTLALTVNAYKNHLQQGKNHHELAVAAAGVRCRPRIRSSAAVDSPVAVGSATAANPPLVAAVSSILSISASSPTRLLTSIIARPTTTIVFPSVVSSGFLTTTTSTIAVTQSTPVPTTLSSSGAVAVAPAQVAVPNAPVEDLEKTTTTATATSTSPFTPNNIKAGIAGGDAYPYVQDHIGWWYDWSPNPSKAGKPIGVPMLWGGGTADATDAARLAAFQKLTMVPTWALGFEEPDCAPGSGSAGMSVDAGVKEWESLMAPLRGKGTKLGSPSMCKQADETWLNDFGKKIKTPWDFTAIHINKNSLDGVKKDIDHYMKYGKPIWVTEFACVADNPNFVPCTDQTQINKFIQDIVAYFESNTNIYAYAYSNGLGLGNVWPMTTSDGKLSASGKTYLDAISKYH